MSAQSDTPRTDAAYFATGATMYSLAGEMKKMERELSAALLEINRLIKVDSKNAAVIDKLQVHRDHYRERFSFWMNEAAGIAKDRAELMNAGDRYPEVLAELRRALHARLGVSPQ